MITLTKENVISYIHDHVPSLHFEDPVDIHMVGDGDLGQDIEGDGYCNFLYQMLISLSS